MIAYYNEIDPKAAAWLRELIKQGHIATGDVDERSIADVAPADLAHYTQCHFFAGIGVWSYALRCAGWPDDRRVWTGSCPCQPFSVAGANLGTADARHLWPEWFRLIHQCRPDTIFGEQVASKHALAWLDHVSTDLEAEGYAVGAVDFPACGVGAPHIRQRLYFVADAAHADRWTGERGAQAGTWANGERRRRLAGGGAARPVADANEAGSSLQRSPRLPGNGHAPRGHDADRRSESVELGNADDTRSQGRGLLGATGSGNGADQRAAGTPGATNGFWAAAEWIACRDGKARPTEPGTFPLVDGTPQRVGRLRGYGNALVAPAAQAFIEAYLSL